MRLLGLVGMVTEFISIRENVRPALCFMRWDIGFARRLSLAHIGARDRVRVDLTSQFIDS